MAKPKLKTEQEKRDQGELLMSLVEKERLTHEEAELLFSMIDKKLFFESLIQLLKYRHLLTEDEIIGLLESAYRKDELQLPITLFEIPSLSALEAICKYLKEEKGMRYTEIAALLNRDQRTIWVTYSNACKKLEGRITLAESDLTVPISVFKDRKMSVLEAIVHYLKASRNLRYVEIAKLISRDERNIWAIYNKADKKLRA